MNEIIYFLSDYNWEKGTIVGSGKKNYKIHTPNTGMHKEWVRYVPKDKCAQPTESVCVVWETWRGTNGRGGYRVERELYPQHRVPAEQVARQSRGHGRVTEKSFGVELWTRYPN